MSMKRSVTHLILSLIIVSISSIATASSAVKYPIKLHSSTDFNQQPSTITPSTLSPAKNGDSPHEAIAATQSNINNPFSSDEITSTVSQQPNDAMPRSHTNTAQTVITPPVTATPNNKTTQGEGGILLGGNITQNTTASRTWMP